MFRRTRPFGVVALVTLLLAGCTTTGNPLDLASFGDVTLVSIQPASGTAGVDPASPITLRFSSPMSTGMETLVVLHEGAIAGPAVAVSASWSEDRVTLKLVPPSALRSKTQYIVHLEPTLMDTDGHMIDLSNGSMMGGARVAAGAQVAGSMMNGRSGTGMMGTGMMGSGRQEGDHLFGMAFSFITL